MMFEPVLSAPGVTPVPERATLNEELEALLVRATFPVALPAAFGAKVTAKLAVCPAAIVAGMLIPLIANPVPVTAAWLTVMLVDPLLRRTTVLFDVPLT